MCGVCSLNKKAHRKARGELNLFHAGSPMERVHLDFLGPLPRTAAGNENVLVLVDQSLPRTVAGNENVLVRSITLQSGWNV